MIRFCENSNDPLFIFLLRYEQTATTSNIKQEIIFSIDSSISLPNMSNFCIPQEKFDPSSEGEVRFIFYLKSNDLYPTYGYVIQFIKNQKRTVYCLLSPYYYPQKLFSIITNYLMKTGPEQKSYLSQNIKPNFSTQESLHDEKQLILNGIKQIISLFDPELIGYLIVCLVLDFHIIITSSNFEILSLFVFAILSTIHPLIWPGVFIPVLPESMVDTILAPFPYIIGMHTSIVEQTENSGVEDHILINVEARTMNFYPDMIKLPKKIRNSIDTFKKKVSNLSLEKYMKFTHYSHNLILDVISYAVGKPPDKPHKLYKHWNLLKGCHNLEPIPQLVCQSQLVLNLMREIENEAESVVFRAYFDEESYEDPSPPKTVFDKLNEKKMKYLRQRSGTTNSQTKPPSNLMDDSDKNVSSQIKKPRGPVQSVKLSQSLHADSSLSELKPSSKTSSETALIKHTHQLQQKQQQFTAIQTIESLASLFASKYENGGCIDSRFKKKEFKTNAGIETPENLSFSSKLNLYNAGFNNNNDNNNNDNSNNNNNNNSNNNNKSTSNSSRKPPLPPFPKK